MKLKTSKSKAAVTVLFVIAILIVLVVVLLQRKSSAPGSTNNQITATPDSSPNQTTPDSFNKKQFSLDDPTSQWVVVNKQRPIAAAYAPTDLQNVEGNQLRNQAAQPMKDLLAAAKNENVPMKIISGYRSYDSQSTVYNRYFATDGQAKADTYSARPGHSEHQTGLAADLGNTTGVCDLETCFGDSAAGKWLVQHAHEYGFVIRYAEDKTAVTGYQYEPWHLRYVGKELAQQLYDTKQTMEEFFGLPAAPSY